MSNSSITVKQAGCNWVKGNESRAFDVKWSKFDEPENHFCHFQRSRKSCDFSTRSRAFPSSEQDTKLSIHFGPHLLNNFKDSLDDKAQNLREAHRLRKVDPLKTAEKFSDANIKKDKDMSHDRVLPFCKELLIKSVKPDLKSKVRRFRTHSSVVPRKAHTEYSKWSNTSSYFSFFGATNPGPQHTPSIISQTPHILTHLQPNEAAKRHFSKLGLSVEQIKGLECLGAPVSKFLPRADVSFEQDPRIPPSYDIDGTSCYWCETPLHVAYGVAFLLKEDPRVVAVALKWNKTSSKVALIQISTVDVILLIAMNRHRQYAPKAINILFRDLEIFKVGVKIEKTLRALWEEFQIESNSYVELEQLLQFSNEKFGRFSSVSQSHMRLHAIASALGYENWGATELTFSGWESHSLSAKQIQYAARNVLVSILLFWSIALGRLVSNASLSDLKVNVEQIVKSVYIRGPISKSYEKIPLIKHRKGLGVCELHATNERFCYT